MVLGGHIHLPYVMALAGFARHMWAAQADTCVSSQVRAGAANSVNLLRWGGDTAPGCCLIEQWDYTASTQGFVCTGVTEIHPSHRSE